MAIIHQYYRRCCKRDVRLRDKYHAVESCQWAGTPVAIIKLSSCTQYETKAAIVFRWRAARWVRAKGMPRPRLIRHQVITVISPSHSVLKSDNMRHPASKRPQVPFEPGAICAWWGRHQRYTTQIPVTRAHKTQENVKQHYKTWIFAFALGPTGQRIRLPETLKCAGATEEAINHQSDYFVGLAEPRFATMLDWTTAQWKVCSSWDQVWKVVLTHVLLLLSYNSVFHVNGVSNCVSCCGSWPTMWT